MSKTKITSSVTQPVETPRGITVHIEPQANGYVGYAEKDGVRLFEITNPTLYLSVAGQLRRYLDMGLSL